MKWFPAGLALASVLTWVVMIGVGGWPSLLNGALLTLGGYKALRWGSRDVAALALTTASLAAFSAIPFKVMWTWVLLVILGVTFAAHRFDVPWCRRGDMNRTIVLWIGIVIAVSAGVLMAWWAVFHPDLTDLAFPPWLSTLHPVVIALFFLAWASANAVAEELFFRGFMQHALVGAIGPAGVLLQAIAFGVFHLHGVPRGASGVVLATIYGLMMGALRARARGLLAPWIAHVVADVVIVLIIIAAVP